jgi:transposase
LYRTIPIKARFTEEEKAFWVLQCQHANSLINRWKPSGRRVERGLYKTATGLLINADCNGAANIARKVATQLG